MVATANRWWSLMTLSSWPTGEPIRLVDETGDAGTIVNADGWRSATPKVVQRVAERGQGERFPGLSRFDLVAARRREPQRAIAERQDRVAPGDLPFPIRPIARERVADLDGSQDPAGRANQNGRVVFHRLTQRTPTELGSRYLGLLAGEEQEEVQTVKAQVSET